jgi:hypothetical protein
MAAHIQGQIFAGQKNLLVQVGSQHGVVIDPPPAGALPVSQPHPASKETLPVAFPDLLDRQAEVKAAVDSIQSTTPIEFSAQDGLGKTSLLQHLAHHPGLPGFPDGIVYHPVYDKSAADVLQILYEDFYSSSANFKPSEEQIANALKTKKAVILLDEVGLQRQEVEKVISSVPESAFVIATTDRRLWQRGRAMNLTGLPLTDSIALMERELGRPLASEERVDAETICKTLTGNPLFIQRIATRVSQWNEKFSDINRQLKPPLPTTGYSKSLLATLSEPERRVLAPMAVMGTVPIGEQNLSGVTGMARVDHVLLSLQRQRLVQAHSPRYSLTGGLAEIIQSEMDLTSTGDGLLAHFVAWAGRGPSLEQFLTEVDVLQRILEWGSGGGRWAEVLRLVRASEAAMALGPRWEVWRQMLERALQAARLLGDQAAEAWALHQLGSRALGSGQSELARQSLTEALRLRESLGDRAGAAVTRHNLNLLGIPPVPPKAARPAVAKPFPIALVLVAAALVGVIIIAFGAWLVFRDGEDETTPPPMVATTLAPVVASTSTFTLTPSLTPSFTPSATWTGTPTPSLTPSITPSISITPSNTPTYTSTPTPSITPSLTPSPTASYTPTPSRTPTVTNTPTPPDLVIGDFTVDNKNILVQYDQIVLPVKLLLRNKGGAPAQNFRIVIYYFDPYSESTYEYPYGAEYPQARYLLEDKSARLKIDENSLIKRLDGFSKFNFTGEIFIPSGWAGYTVTFIIYADDCPDDEGYYQPDCRVFESREDNNDFPLTISLPGGSY